MSKRPSHRSHLKHRGVAINLVPMLDTFVTLIGFLLYSMATFALVSHDAPIPFVSNQNTTAEPTLQLSVSMNANSVKFFSPFLKIDPVEIPHLHSQALDRASILRTVERIKNKFPDEDTAILFPDTPVHYAVIIEMMDLLREKNRFRKLTFGNLNSL